MKSIINFIINTFRIMFAAIMGLMDTIAATPKAIYGQINGLLAVSGQYSEAQKAKGGFVNGLIGFGYTVAGIAIVTVYMLYIAVMIWAVIVNPINMLISFGTGLLVTAIFMAILVPRDVDGLVNL